MGNNTLQEMAREVHLYSDAVCPILLCQRFVRDAYRKILRRAMWSFQLGRGQFNTINQYNTGTVTVTNNSATVTGSGTSWTSALINQQFKSGGAVYTVTAVGSTTSLTIDKAWAGATASGQTYTILTAYVTPSDQDANSAYNFKSFYSIVDPATNVVVTIGNSAFFLDIYDPNRSATTGDPVIVLRGGDPGVGNNTALAGLPQFELWPHVTTLKQYQYIFEKILPDLASASDTPNELILSDVVVRCALLDLVRWSGTPERKNPMYDPTLVQFNNRTEEFEKELAVLIQQDAKRSQAILSREHSLWTGIGA